MTDMTEKKYRLSPSGRAEALIARALKRLGEGAQVTQQQTLTLALLYAVCDLMEQLRQEPDA